MYLKEKLNLDLFLNFVYHVQYKICTYIKILW